MLEILLNTTSRKVVVTGGVWERVTDFPGTPRTLGRACAIGTKIYFYGGRITTGSIYMNDTWCYDTEFGTWTQVATGPVARYAHHCVAIDGKMYVHGGCFKTTAAMDMRSDLLCYDPETDVWSSLAGNDTPLSYGGAAVVNGKMYIYGGLYYQSGSTGQYTSQTLRCYDPATNKWSNLPNWPGAGTWSGMLSAIGDMLYASGGNGPPYNSVSRYNTLTRAWTNAAKGGGRIAGVTANIGDRIYSYGGGALTLNIFDRPTNTWSTGTAGPIAMYELTGAVVGDSWYLGLGGVVEFWKYTPS